MKKLVYKYTIKPNKKAPVKTHYVLAYDESLARTGLAEHLDVNVDMLRFNPKNLPFRIRQAIFDKNNTEYQLTLDVKKKPTMESTVEERKAAAFDLKASKLKSLKYQVQAFVRQDKELLLQYSGFNEAIVKQHGGYKIDQLVDHFTYGVGADQKAYNDLKKTIVENNFQDEEVDGVNLLDMLECTRYDVKFTFQK
jgi:hypothetical protein